MGFRCGRLTIEVDEEALAQPGWAVGIQRAWRRIPAQSSRSMAMYESSAASYGGKDGTGQAAKRSITLFAPGGGRVSRLVRFARRSLGSLPKPLARILRGRGVGRRAMLRFDERLAIRYGCSGKSWGTALGRRPGGSGSCIAGQPAPVSQDMAFHYSTDRRMTRLQRRYPTSALQRPIGSLAALGRLLAAERQAVGKTNRIDGRDEMFVQKKYADLVGQAEESRVFRERSRSQACCI